MTVGELQRALGAAAGGGLTATVRRELVKARLVAEREAKRNATEQLSVRTGRLRGSIRGTLEEIDHWPALVLRAGGGAKDVGYARIQEFGGVVTAKGGGYLTIPLGRAMTKSGVLRQSARSTPGLFAIRSKAGNLLLVRKRGKGIEPMFLLRKSVTIQPHYYLRDAMRVVVERLPAGLAQAVAVDILPHGRGA